MYKLKIEEPDKLFFTSDTHFNHFNICKYCDRPFTSRSEMNETLISNWNSVVPEDGIVVHCGDFTLQQDFVYRDYDKIANKLNGKILLIRGNHDRVPITLVPHNKFLAIVDIAEINVDDIKITVSHYPLLAYPTDMAVFGHIHTLSDGTCHGIDGDITTKLRPNQYDVGVDQNNYTPISYFDICRKMRIKAKNYE